LRSNTKGYGDNSLDSQNSDTTALSGRELYYLQLSLQAASLETFGYTLIWKKRPACLLLYVTIQDNSCVRKLNDENSNLPISPFTYSG
jgi:hypothetical protein